MSTIDIPDEPDDIDGIALIDIRSGDRSAPFVHRVEPVSKTTKAIKFLESHPDVQISSAAVRRIVFGAVEPGLLEGARLERHRVETGWLSVISYRAYTLLLSPAIENDRLLDEAHYAADPDTGNNQRVLSMPTGHDTEATLVYADAMDDLLAATDRASMRVREVNAQEVGRRIVERPLTAVPATFLNPGRHPDDDLNLVDGNSRWASCTAGIKVPSSSIRPTNAKAPDSLLPSHLMRLPLAERRDLVREIVKNAHRDIDGAAGTSRAARAKRDQAARLLNAMTVPVQVIVGYTDDNPSMGMRRFPVAVRSLLMRMNIGVKEFKGPSKNGVTAEEIVTALFDSGELGDDAQAVRDVLLGRADVTDAMKALGLNPAFRDLRFTYVVQQLTRKESRLNAVMAAKLDKRSLQVTHRSGPIVELGLRSYSSLPREKLAPVRTALDTGCLWQALADHEWTVENIDSDQAVDDLLERADNGDVPARLLLGVLAMVTLVTSGYLLAPGGSAEQIVGGIKVMRAGVGTVVKTVLDTKEGRQVLADAIKRIRAGLRPRWWADGRLVEREKWKGSDFNAHLRLAANHGFVPEGYQNDPTATELEDKALTAFQTSLTAAGADLDDLIALRKMNGTTTELSWTVVEPSFKQLSFMGSDLARIAESEPR
ncbi:hypothetical protein [Streptomyces prunicolor]|uniref:hypothetical protein n=1 Tax=Streptomyces prunicolor TaxID=67348 RepID=UPI00037A4143|nr:hypothetical protein [Streptomyces prunicolor]